MGRHIAVSDEKGFVKSCLYSETWETDGDMLRDGNEDDGEL
jgi:hypothetical protein